MHLLRVTLVLSAILIFPPQDKEKSIPHEELGRNITTVQVLQRKHETFERELTALGNKVGLATPTRGWSMLGLMS